MLELSIFLFAVLMMLFLGGVVYVHDPKKGANQLFLIWVIFATIWMMANFLENLESLSFKTRALFLHLDFSSSAVGCGFLTLFVLVFINAKLKVWQRVSILLPGVIMAIISFSSLLLERVFIATGAIAYVEGPLYELYGIVILGYVISSAIILLLAIRRSQGNLKRQMHVMAISLLGTLLISIPINFFLQNFLSYQVVRIGIYAFLIFVGGTAYSIVKHEFLRIRFIVIEFFLLGMLATLLTRLIFSTSLGDFSVNLASISILLVLGFFLVRNVLREIIQKEKLELLTKQLKEANEKLKALDALKTEFLSIASHQLRTPLSVIRGYVDMIEEGAYGKLNARLKPVIEKIHASTGALIELVGQLLLVSRIESGRTVMEIGAIDLVSLCQEVSEFLSLKAKERELELICHKSSVSRVMGDASKVKEVIMNLVENALKYTEKGNVGVYFIDEPKFVRVEVRDTGSGLTKEDLGKLFQKFSRTSSADVNGAAGTGLGLYVAKRMIEAMGGEIWAESKGRLKGSTFAFRLKKASGNAKKQAVKRKVV